MSTLVNIIIEGPIRFQVAVEDCEGQTNEEVVERAINAVRTTEISVFLDNVAKKIEVKYL